VQAEISYRRGRSAAYEHRLTVAKRNFYRANRGDETIAYFKMLTDGAIEACAYVMFIVCTAAWGPVQPLVGGEPAVMLPGMQCGLDEAHQWAELNFLGEFGDFTDKYFKENLPRT